MMERTTDRETLALVRRAVPGYKGRTIYAAPYHGGMSLNSYWDGGCRDYWTFFHVRTGARIGVEQNGTMFDGKNLVAPATLPADTVLVQHAYSGQRQYVVVHR